MCCIPLSHVSVDNDFAFRVQINAEDRGNHMPAEILEKPADVEELSGQIVKDTTAVRVNRPTIEQPPAEPAKSLWRRIFEGHEEFLGWTPD